LLPWTKLFGSRIAPIQKFDATDSLVVSFSSSAFAAADGNMWVTDALPGDGKGEKATKLSPDGPVGRNQNIRWMIDLRKLGARLFDSFEVDAILSIWKNVLSGRIAPIT
jgi:hypothetical protein